MNCPNGELSIEAVKNFAMQNTAFEYDKVTDPAIIKEIIDILVAVNPGLPVRSTSDMFILYIGQAQGFLAEFVNGCSSFAYPLDQASTLAFIKFLGLGI